MSMLNPMPQKITNYTLCGECTKCGQCCSDVLPMTKAELETIKRYVQKHNIQSNKKPCAQEILDLTCCFYDSKKRTCAIYPVRPSICKIFICSQDKKLIEANKIIIHNKPKTKVYFLRDEIYKEGSCELMAQLVRQMMQESNQNEEDKK